LVPACVFYPIAALGEQKVSLFQPLNSAADPSTNNNIATSYKGQMLPAPASTACASPIVADLQQARHWENYLDAVP
jgi:hypothetical protein